MPESSKLLTASTLGLLLLAATGCADPWLQINRLNPVTARQWQEDEAYLATLHTKLAAIEGIRRDVDSLSPANQQQWSLTLAQIIEHDDNALLRAAAVKTLSLFPPQLSGPALAKALEDGSANVRIAACEAWCDQQPGPAVEHLARILGSDTDLDVQIAAAKGLSNFQDPRAVSALALALDSKDPALQYRATRSLAEISPVDYGRDVVAWKQYLQGQPPAQPQSGWSTLMARLPWSPWR